MPGTRVRLDTALGNWLNGSGRMFLLLAEPAMGKSVACAAVCQKIEETCSKELVQVRVCFNYLRSCSQASN